jgi:uridine kinase
MKGDKIIIKPHHERAAAQVAEIALPEIVDNAGRFVISVAGESGAGKSEIAAALAVLLDQHGLNSEILQQDDYFVYPPKTNAAVRRKDIGHVGVAEVHIDLLDDNLERFKKGDPRIVKPLVDFDADSIGEETLELGEIDVILVEGTYTTVLEHVDRRVFIDRTYIDTRDARALRAREDQDDYLERILTIEHDIISSHKSRADFIVNRDYNVTAIEPND